MTSDEPRFRVGLSRDLLDEQRQLIFPDIGLGLLHSQPGLEYEFLSDYRPEYDPEQISGYDVLISLKPRVPFTSRRGTVVRRGTLRCGLRQRGPGSLHV